MLRLDLWGRLSTCGRLSIGPNLVRVGSPGMSMPGQPARESKAWVAAARQTWPEKAQRFAFGVRAVHVQMDECDRGGIKAGQNGWHTAADNFGGAPLGKILSHALDVRPVSAGGNSQSGQVCATSCDFLRGELLH